LSLAIVGDVTKDARSADIDWRERSDKRSTGNRSWRLPS
jgi:hypothetical protein